MSIAVLKKKTFNNNPRIAPISGNGQFALNGTRRIIGVVGPTNLAKKNIKVWENQATSLACEANSSTVYLSVKNTKGMLESKWSRCSVPNCNKLKPIVQPMDSGNIKLHTQGQYIYHKRAGCYYNNNDNNNNKDCSPKTEQIIYEKPCLNTCEPNQNYIGTTKVFKGRYAKKGKGAISQQDYLNEKYIKSKALLLAPNRLPHFPMNITNSGCNKFYKTYEEYEKSKRA